jgi:rubrerythrin
MPLSKEQLSAVYDKINAGDKEAMKFIVDYPSMSDEEANSYLAKLAISGKKTIMDLILMNEFLIKDENEAINGYDKAILLARALGNKEAEALYETIKQQELNHIEMLTDLNDKLKSLIGKGE